MTRPEPQPPDSAVRAPDCQCPIPTLTGRGECGSCGRFVCEYANKGETLVGVCIVSRPVARTYQDGLTLEVSRTATDGTKNANSMLYGAAWRATKALGYGRLITYTQADESGASLRAAGWRVIAERSARKGWDAPSRPRDNDKYISTQRTLWEAV